MDMERTALVTGASSGIGKAFSIELARKGYHLVLVARNEEALTQLAQELKSQYNCKVWVIIQDLSVVGAAKRIYDVLQEKKVHIDTIISNAGIIFYDDFIASPNDRDMAIIPVHITFPTELFKLLIPKMVAKKYGQILIVSSPAAFAPNPGAAINAASKVYITWLALSLSEELKGSGVTITVLYPGFTKTELFTRGQADQALIIKKAPFMTAEAVAKIGYNAMEKGKLEIIPGWKNKFMMRVTSWLPRKFQLSFTRKLLKK